MADPGGSLGAFVCTAFCCGVLVLELLHKVLQRRIPAGQRAHRDSDSGRHVRRGVTAVVRADEGVKHQREREAGCAQKQQPAARCGEVQQPENRTPASASAPPSFASGASLTCRGF